MKNGCKCLGRIWGVPSLFRDFLGIFPCMESGFLALCVHYSGVHSIFFSTKWLTRGASQWHCVVHWALHYAVDSSLSLSLRGPGVQKEGKRRGRAAVANVGAILGSTCLNGCNTIGVGPQDRGREGDRGNGDRTAVGR